jgi:hypothetical protein
MCPNYADGAPSHAAGVTGSPRQRNWKFESIPLQRRVCKPPVPRGRTTTGDELGIAPILKIRKMDKDEHDEQESLLDIYKRALGMLPDADATAQAAE